MKNILNKFFPEHTTATAACIVFFILLVLLVAGFTINEPYDINYVAMGAFTLIGSGVYVFGKKGK